MQLCAPIVGRAFAAHPRPCASCRQVVADGGELLAPAPHRLVGDDDASLSQDQLNIARAEAEHVMQSGSVPDDLGREPMTIVCVGRRHHASISPGATRAAQFVPAYTGGRSGTLTVDWTQTGHSFQPNISNYLISLASRTGFEPALPP